MAPTAGDALRAGSHWQVPMGPGQHHNSRQAHNNLVAGNRVKRAKVQRGIWEFGLWCETC
jgi:hypothetical protein